MLWEWLGYSKPAGEGGDQANAAASSSSDGGSKRSMLPPESVKKVSNDEDIVHTGEMTADENAREQKMALRKKLREVAGEHGGGAANPHAAVTYDSLWRAVNKVLMEGHTSAVMEMHEGFQIHTSKNFQNAMMTNKWTFGSPQSAGWETNLTMQGFGDVIMANYSTAGRWSLQYQRPFKAGAFMVLQAALQPTPIGPQSGVFAMMQYPWAHHGTTNVSYVKNQHVNVSHCSRLVRGVHIGASMNYDLASHGTTTSYAATTTSADKKMHWAAEVKPETAEWKLGCAKSLWHSDTEVAAEIEVKETQQSGKVSLMSVGVRKPLIGGGSLHAVMSNFRRVKAVLELPFGHDRSKVNVQYCVNYDSVSGGAKHGLTVTL